MLTVTSVYVHVHSGALDESTLRSVLSSLPSVPLSSTQVYAILCDHRPSDGRYKLRPFARKTAHMLLTLFSSDTRGERSDIIARSRITPVQLLSRAARKRIEHQMRARFDEFDSNDDGFLSPQEFANLMADTALVLSTAEIERLFVEADTNKDGKIDMQEFLAFATSKLLHLQRDVSEHASSAVCADACWSVVHNRVLSLFSFLYAGCTQITIGRFENHVIARKCSCEIICAIVCVDRIHCSKM